MMKYDKYKSSGIDWMGDIPKDWEVKRVKDVIKSLVGGGTPSTNKSEYWNGSIPWVSAKDMKYDRIIDSIDYVSELGIRQSSSRLISSNSILIVVRSGILKHTLPVAINDVSVAINQDLKAIVPNKTVSVEFLLRIFKGFSANILMNCQKVSVTVESIELQEFLNFPITIPPVQTQIQIANYLDTKTQSIDKKINLLTQKANYYKEYRKSLINETVCKGLDKNVKLKNSEVHYINSIAQHWKTERIKDLFSIGRGRVIGQELLIEEGKYPVYSSQTENNGCLGYIETFDFDNDLLTWTTDGANAGTVFRRSGKFNCTNVCGTLIPKRKNLDLDYVVYALQESASHNKRIDTNGAKIMNNEMGVIKIAFPPLSEQTQIANYLDQKTQTIDKIVSNINTTIDTLKELRKTLINDAVTGKIKVVS